VRLDTVCARMPSITADPTGAVDWRRDGQDCTSQRTGVGLAHRVNMPVYILTLRGSVLLAVGQQRKILVLMEDSTVDANDRQLARVMATDGATSVAERTVGGGPSR